MTNGLKNLALLTSVAAVSLLVCEFAFRLLNGAPLFELKDYRADRGIAVDFREKIAYDARLGWMVKENHVFPELSTGAYGIRRNNPDHAHPRKGGILVSGSSFAAGSEVADPQAWPAQLEQIIDAPVDNAAVGGFAVDQIVMRAEQLIPILEPKVVIIQAMDTSIQWASHSVVGYPKPYFTLTGDKLVAHNNPVPRTRSQDALLAVGPVKRAAGYSLIIDRIMSTIDAEAWYAQSKSVKVKSDPVNVSCALLKRLKRQTEKRDIRTVLVTMSSAADILSSAQAPSRVRGVEACARTMGFEVVSVFPHMRALYEDDPTSLGLLYIPHGPAFGHSTSDGNRHVAKLVAEALSAPQAAQGHASDYAPVELAFVPEDGRNLLSEALSRDDLIAATANLELSEFSPSEAAADFAIRATGSGEHYATLAPTTLDQPTPVRITFDVRPHDAAKLRVQFLTGSSGLLADIDPQGASTNTSTFGPAEIDHAGADVVPLPNGWYRVAVWSSHPASQLIILLQLRDAAGQTSFRATTQAARLRGLRLERGRFVGAQTRADVTPN